MKISSDLKKHIISFLEITTSTAIVQLMVMVFSLLLARYFWLKISRGDVSAFSLATLTSIMSNLGLDTWFLRASYFFDATDFFVAPYLDGSQSGSIKLAMGYNLPIIVSDVITDPIILNYSSGLSVFESGNVNQLVKAIKEIKLSSLKAEIPVEIGNKKSWQNSFEALLRG